MPALPPGMPINVPAQVTLPQDLPALASGQAPAAPAAPAPAAPAPAAPAPAAPAPAAPAPASPAGPMAPLLSALP
jgi:hypothetical protein